MLLLGLASPPSTALAHGKELDITVDSLVPDAAQPLRVLYRVTVVYAGDEDPVEDAAVVLTARHAGSAAETPPLALTELDGSAGTYVGEAVFERFGEWDMHLDVEATLGLGTGSADFVDDIRPEPADAALDAARRAEAERVASLQLLFGFEWWPDVVTVLIRIIHSVAGLAYFVASGLVLVLAWFGVPGRRPDLLDRVARRFLPVASLSLGALLLAGLYTAAFDAPVAWPGIYDLSALLSIPYGDAYLAAFLIKVVSFVLLVVMAYRIHRTLDRWSRSPVPDADAASIAILKRQSLINAAIGLLVLADVAVVIYLHYISHLGVFVV
jgi:hypothetical protein